MAEVIQFDNEKDRLRAMEALDQADETYQCIPPRRFLISAAAAVMLRSRGIPMCVLGEQPEEHIHGPRP